MLPRLLVLVLLTVSVVIACSPQNTEPAPGVVASFGSSVPSALDAPPALTRCTNTVRLQVLQDKSKSATPNGVYQLRPDDLRGIADVIIRCGGELGVGIVGLASGNPIHRWFVTPPQPSPAPPSSGESAINAAIDAADFQRQLKKWTDLDAQRVSAARKTFEEFLDRVTVPLSQSPDDGTTPLWLALARADAFLGEPDLPSMPSHRYLVLSSDGQNTSGDPMPMTSGATLFISNGPLAIGSLDKLRFTIVESPIAAFRLIGTLEAAYVSEQ